MLQKVVKGGGKPGSRAQGVIGANQANADEEAKKNGENAPVFDPQGAESNIAVESNTAEQEFTIFLEK